MKELSLFSGAGGGLLASKHLLGWETLGYVEINEYCQKVIAQRIKDGLIDDAPIFTDIKAFNDQGYAESYQGLVDVVSGGFPCQPFSQCGHKKGEKDNRNLWPETISTIRNVQPEFVFLENVPSLLVFGYVRRIFGDLAESGYNAKWCVLGGGDTGSICQSKRLWIFAFKTNRPMLESMDISENFITGTEESFGWQHSRAISKALSQDDYTKLKRNPDEVARGMEQLKAIGNGQDPIVAATAWEILSKGSR
jgi:DNA (cytosine-5)-methyltransferase 1